MRFGTAYGALTRAQKPARGVSLYSRYVNRPLGKMLAAGCAQAGLSPNGVTLLSACLTVAAAALIATQPPSGLVGLGAATLLVLGFAFDSADGQLARLLQRSSPVGEWFDHVVDAGKAVGVHGAVLVGAYRYFDISPVWLLLPLFYQVVNTMIQAGGTLRELLGRTVGSSSAATRSVPRRWSPLVLLVADFGILSLSFLTWGWPHLFVVIYSLLFLANCAVGAALLFKWARELSALRR